jgi:cell division protein FtsL
MAEQRRHAAHSKQHRARRRRGAVVLVVLGLVVVVVLFAFVYPTRTFLQQRKEVGAAERQLAVLEQNSRTLRTDNARLESDAEVERRAREDFGMVRPGETPYVLVPAPPPTTATTALP